MAKGKNKRAQKNKDVLKGSLRARQGKGQKTVLIQTNGNRAEANPAYPEKHSKRRKKPTKACERKPSRFGGGPRGWKQETAQQRAKLIIIYECERCHAQYEENPGECQVKDPNSKAYTEKCGGRRFFPAEYPDPQRIFKSPEIKPVKIVWVCDNCSTRYSKKPVHCTHKIYDGSRYGKTCVCKSFRKITE